MPSPQIAVDVAELNDFHWDSLFAEPRPIELEIGTGKAGFLLRRAQANPQRNFFGIEWANEFYRYAVDRMQRWGMTNVRLLRADASEFIRLICPRNSLAALHVYHPDPWPKRRHWKRRLFQPRFINAAVECLIPGARWAVQTDHAEYYAAIVELLRGHPELEEIPFEDPTFGVTELADDDVTIETNFEIKYRKEGRNFYRIAMQKKES